MFTLSGNDYMVYAFLNNKDNKLNIYNLDEFKYLINKEELRGNNVIAVTK